MIKKIIFIYVTLMIAAFLASCASRPELSNKPKHITLAKYRTGDIVQIKGYEDCTAKIINIIDDNSDSYYYQLVISCMDSKIIKIVPQIFMDNQKEGE